MKNLKLSLIWMLPALLAVLSCEPTSSDREAPAFDGTGYQPIYASKEAVTDVRALPARTLKNPGKIYVYGSYLFINERGTGVHIVDNSDPSTPRNRAFVSIPGCYDMAVKGNFLYADNTADLVVLDMSDPTQVTVRKRIADVVPVLNYPTQQNIYFECADASRGVIVGWEKVSMSKKPKCFR